jgi:hypothetical protein
MSSRENGSSQTKRCLLSNRRRPKLRPNLIGGAQISDFGTKIDNVSCHGCNPDSASSPVPGSSAVALSGRSRPAVLLINPGAMKLLVREDIVLRSLTILGGRHMADPVRHLWTSEEIEKLRAMAGNHRREKIAAELNRGAPAVALKAHQLGISLRYHAMPKRRPSTAESAPRK